VIGKPGASAIHNQISRRQGPFVTLNCAVIPGPLLDSELFGQEKGGTLFLGRISFGALRISGGNQQK
jgi:transcriptional regulator with PAS, ATPase and Fis domain